MPNRTSWPTMPCGTPGTSGSRPRLCLQFTDRQRAGGECAADPPAALQVADRRAHDVDPRVRVVDPVDRNLVDPQTDPFGDHQQLGVEEPAGVGDQREQLTGDVSAHRLEAALGVGESRTEHAAQQQVITARNEFALRAANHPRGCGQPRPDREIGMARNQRRHQGHQRRQSGGQVDIHVDDDVGRRRHPRRVQGTAAALGVEVDDVDIGQFLGQLVRHREGVIRTCVVGHRDPRRVGHVGGEILVESTDAAGQVAFLVVDRDHDVEHVAASCSAPR